MSQPAASATHTIEVRVKFPLSARRRYEERVGRHETVGQVRADAMAHFGVHDDAQYAYYLTHRGDRLMNERTIADVARRDDHLELTLVKELLQG